MPQAITPVNEDEYVLIKYFDKLDEAASKKSIDKVESILNKYKWEKILIDLTEAEFIPSVFQMFIFLGKHVFLFSNDIHIALLIYDEEKQNARFCETVAQNRGIDLKVFFEKKGAIEWIKNLKY